MVIFYTGVNLKPWEHAIAVAMTERNIRAN